MKKRLVLLSVIALLYSVSSVCAQEQILATIDYTSGDDLLIIRSGRKLNFTDAIGLELFQGDQIQTGRGVFVEVRLLSGGAVVKLAENTTFKIEQMINGQTSLALVYGRLRAKVDRLAGTDTFLIRSASSVAGVRGTDFGVDVVALQQAAVSSSLTRTYVFEGSVIVTALLRSSPLAAEGLEPIPRDFTLEAGEMVEVSRVDIATEAQRAPISIDIRKFWSSNDFTTIDVPDILLPPEIQEPVESSTAPPELESSSPAAELSQELLKDAFDRGYSSGYPDGYEAALAELPETVPQEQIPPQEFVLPEGLLSLDESTRIRNVLTLQRGGVIGGSLLVTAAAGLAGTAFWQSQSGDTEGSLDKFRLAAIVSISALPFFISALFARP